MTSLKTAPAAEMVTVTVNDKEMQLPKGKNLLQALLDVGHYIPHYCYHPSLSVSGNCRLCLIEIEGRPKPEISCNMVVMPDMKIKTEGELVESCRKGMMEFLLVNHPLDCPICDRGGECMLQRYSMEYGTGTARTADWRRRFEKPQLDPLIDIERNRCIMCTRCVRFVDEVGGEHVMGVFSHGDNNYIGTFGNGPVSNIFSGNVIDLCPVGCLTSRPFRFQARAWELRQTQTTTRTCNGPVTAWSRGGKLYRVTPPARKRNGQYTLDEDTTQFISNEARFGSMYANNDARLTVPMVKTEGKLVESDWDAVLDMAANAMNDAGEATAILVGERSTNEEAYLLGRLAREAVGTTLIDWRSRFVNEAAAQAAGTALAASDGDFDLFEKQAYASTVVIGADLLQTAPDIALRVREAVRLGKTKLSMIDSRSDSWFGNLAGSVCIEQPEALAGTITKLAEALTGGQTLEGYGKTLEAFKAEQGLIVLGLDQAGGADNPAMLAATKKLLAALGAGWHFLPVTAARNAKGAFYAGAQSDRLPGGKASGSAAAAPAILEQAAAGNVKTLFLNRCDELVNHPNRALVEKALKTVETLIVIDIFPSWITELATIVLPGSLFYENNGSMTDIDGTLQRMSQGSRPMGKAQEEWRIALALAKRLGQDWGFKTAADIFGVFTEACGMKLRLDDFLLEGAGAEAPQRHTPRMGQKTRPNFKLHGSGRDALPACGESATAGNGLRLLWIEHCQGLDHLGGYSTEFDRLRPVPKVELNPLDAARDGLAEGDWVLLDGGSDQPCQVAYNKLLAEGVAYGAANVLGLTLEGAGSALPTVTLRRTEAPADLQANDAVGATA